MKEPIVLIGGGGHAKVIIDIIRATQHYDIVGICDYKEEEVYGVPVLGGDDRLPVLYNKGVKNAFICIGALGNPQKRWALYKQLKQIGYELPSLIHPTAWVSPSVTISEGTCVMAGALINADAQVGKMAIVNTGSIIEHDCIVGDNSHISPGACLCGGVRIGKHTHIGAKSIVNQNITIGNEVVVGSGSTVVKNIEDKRGVKGMAAQVF